MVVSSISKFRQVYYDRPYEDANSKNIIVSLSTALIEENIVYGVASIDLKWNFFQ